MENGLIRRRRISYVWVIERRGKSPKNDTFEFTGV